MSGIYIPGVEMPKTGERALWLVIHSDGVVEYEDNKGFGWKRATATHVPEHGRLIDADALAYEYDEDSHEWGYDIHSAPTIIPADKGGEG